MEAFIAAARACGNYPYLRQVTSDIWIHFPDTWEDYLAHLGKATRYNFHRREAQLTRDFGAENVSLEILTDAGQCAFRLGAFITLHRQRWQHQRGNHFNDPRMGVFYRAAVRWAADNGYLAIPIMRIHSRTIALMTIFHIPGQDTAYLHFVAREIDALPGKYSPESCSLPGASARSSSEG